MLSRREKYPIVDGIMKTRRPDVCTEIVNGLGIVNVAKNELFFKETCRICGERDSKQNLVI